MPNNHETLMHDMTKGSNLVPPWLNIAGASLIFGLFGFVSAAWVTVFVQRASPAQVATFTTLVPLWFLAGVFAHYLALLSTMDAALSILAETRTMAFTGWNSFLRIRHIHSVGIRPATVQVS